ncbi:hypothetical protein Q8F55_008390 [Vanrija albida]|uniref:Methyltransferase domain-containing protein n=1 Tax=Vanrija albida TaxID=181172 RepID=A0ABR3PW85_9TREE
MTGPVVIGLENVPESDGRAYHSDKDSIYPLPADTDESARLTLQHKLIVGLFGGLLQPPVKEYIESHEHPAVVDVGCGPGDWIKDIKAAYPNAECSATDFAPTFASDPSTPVAFEFGNVLKRLPYADGQFDVTHMRMMVAALRADEWPHAIAEVIRITKPGGWIQLTELELKFHAPKAVTGAIKELEDESQEKFFGARNTEYFAAHRLPQYLTMAGLPSASVQVQRGYWDRTDVGGLGEAAFNTYYAVMQALSPVLATFSGNSVAYERARASKAMVEGEEQGVWMNWVTVWARKPKAGEM